MKKRIYTYLGLLGLVSPAFVSKALADSPGGIDPTTDWWLLFEGAGWFGDGADLSDVIIIILRWLLIAGVIVALFFAILGGFQYITAGGDAEKAGAGRTMLLNAIIGMIIMFAAYAVIGLIWGVVNSNV
ncbi:hypothetical protein ACFL14_00215 [Patescibacteria group bacterium]